MNEKRQEVKEIGRLLLKFELLIIDATTIDAKLLLRAQEQSREESWQS